MKADYLPLQLETVAGFDSELGRVTWGLCLPGGGDTLFDLSPHLSPDEQECIANQIAAAFPPRETGEAN
jgi:hypothetical protein